LFFSIDIGMDTCHHCHEVVEKLNLEYDSLNEENEGHKQAIEFIRREMELRKLITEELCKVKWFKKEMSIEMGIKCLVRNFNRQEDDIKDMSREMEQLEEENYNLERQLTASSSS